MSNVNSPFGFKYIGSKTGGMTYGYVQKKIAAANNTPIYRGDLVYGLTTGYIAQSSAGQSVTLAQGIFWGCEYLSTSQGKQIFSTYWPNGDHAVDGVAWIIPLFGPGGAQLFKVQALSTAIPFASIGSNIDINVASGSVTSGVGVSGMTVDGSTVSTGQGSSGATGAAYPFKVYDLYSNYATNENGTDNTSNYNIVIVEPNPFAVAGVH